MDSLFILIPVALLFTAIAIKIFIWAVNNKQYDDLDAAAQSILFDDDLEIAANKKKSAAESDECQS